jgi:heme O synthase-like polyprenyltransferase
MKAPYPGSRRKGRYVHRKEIHILSAVAAVFTFTMVYAYGGDAKLYYGIAAAAVMACAIYFANYLQFNRGHHA